MPRIGPRAGFALSFRFPPGAVAMCRHHFKGNTLADLIASLKAYAGNASYGSSGIGSPTHLAGELFKSETGADIVHVPYRGLGAAANDPLGGQLQVMFPSVPDTLTLIVAGQLRALAVMSDRRLKLLPDLPTTAELGVAQAHQFVLGRSVRHGRNAAAGSRPAQSRAGADREVPRLCGSGRAARIRSARDYARRIRPIQCRRD